MAYFIAMEGIDGSGKGTQTNHLKTELEKRGLSVGVISFPQYEKTLHGELIGRFLNAEYGSLDEVHPLFASLLFAGDRWESRPLLMSLLETHNLVIADRYVASNIAHQGAKLQTCQQEELIRHIRTIEYEHHSLPVPDLTFLFDLPATQAQNLILKKQQRSYTDQKTDMQEADAAYLSEVRNVYLKLSTQEDSWHVISVMKEGLFRTIEEIGQEVYIHVESEILPC